MCLRPAQHELVPENGVVVPKEFRRKKKLAARLELCSNQSPLPVWRPHASECKLDFAQLSPFSLLTFYMAFQPMPSRRALPFDHPEWLFVKYDGFSLTGRYPKWMYSVDLP